MRLWAICIGVWCLLWAPQDVAARSHRSHKSGSGDDSSSKKAKKSKKEKKGKRGQESKTPTPAAGDGSTAGTTAQVPPGSDPAAGTAGPAGGKPKTGRAAEIERATEAGLRALAAGRFDAAEQAFVQAYSAEARPELLYFLARSAAAQGEGILARDMMRRYMQDPEREPSAARQALAQQILDEPPPAGVLTGDLTVVGPRGALVRVDGHPMGTLPSLLPLQLPVGPHTVLLESGSTRLDGQVVMAAGAELEIRFQMESRTVLASAPPPLIALLSAGKTAEEKQLFSLLEQAAVPEGLLIIDRKEALKRAKELSPCLDQLSCQMGLATRNEAAGLLMVHVEPSGGGQGGYVVTARYLDARVAGVVATVTEQCVGCRSGEVRDLAVAAALRSYREGWAKPRGKLVLTGQPANAEVSFNGRDYLKLPLRLTPIVGTLSIAARAPGHRSRKEQVTIRAEGTSTVEVVLEPGSGASSAVAATGDGSAAGRTPMARLSPFLFWGGVGLVGGGLLLSGFGISGLSVHGRCTSAEMADVICPQVFDTATKGGVLLGVGLTLTVAGTVGIVLGRHTLTKRKD